MSSVFGIYEKVMNTVEQNAPSWMREDAVLLLFKEYDKYFNPILSEVFPRTPGPRMPDGEVVSVDTTFELPYTANPQGMANWMGRYDLPPVRSVAFQREEVQGRLMKEWGPTFNPDEFTSDIRAGLLEKRNQMLISQVMDMFSRRLEYTLCNITRVDQTELGRFGNQYTFQSTRKKTLDAGETVTTEADYLGGLRWDEAAADPMKDIDNIVFYANDMAQMEITRGFIGAKTAKGIESNTTIREFIKYHYDMSERPIGASIKGIVLKKVLGQTYKRDPQSSGRLGYPAMGDVRPNNYTTTLVQKMMTHSVSSVDYEWGLFCGNAPIGNTFTVKAFPQQRDTNLPYAREWTEPRTNMTHSELCWAVAPAIEDAGAYIVVDRMALA